jgi:hypothetical protein
MLTARFLALPAIALTVIAALAQVHGGASINETESPTVYRAVTCSAPTATMDASCAHAGNAPARLVR